MNTNLFPNDDLSPHPVLTERSVCICSPGMLARRPMKLLFKYLLVLLIFGTCSTHVFGQLDTLLRVRQFNDSAYAIAGGFQTRIDSLGKAVTSSTSLDTIGVYRQRVDSVTQRVEYTLDSIRQSYAVQLKKINTLQEDVQAKIDSLARRALPVSRLSGTMDSLQSKAISLKKEAEGKISTAQSEALSKLDALDLPPQLKTEINGIKQKITGIIPTDLLKQPVQGVSIPRLSTINTATAALPSLTKPAINLAATPGLPAGIGSVGNITAASSLSLPATPGVPDNIIKEIPQKAEVTGAVSEIKSLQTQPIDLLADNKVLKIAEVSDIKEQAQIRELASIQSEEALKNELARQARTVAVDHFSAQQQQLKSAMEKLSAYKKKYGEMTSLADANKKPVDPVKNKKWSERISSGMNIQIQKKGEDVLVDFNPYIGYLLSKRLVIGAGWNERVAYNWDQRLFHSDTRIYGPRLFGEYLLSKGFSPRIEMEVMNTLVPPATVKQGDPYSRLWVPGAFAGIKKQYKISGQLRGTATVMFRLFDPHRQSPYGDAINARFGFEYSFKKKASRK